MNRIRIIIAAAVGLYALAMSVAWIKTSELAYDKTVDALLEAREAMIRNAEDTVDSVLWYLSRLIVAEMGDTARKLPLEQMQAISARYHLDELNVVDAGGKVIASDPSNEIGFDFYSNPNTEEFMQLLSTNAIVTSCSQPYRNSVNSTNVCYKYYGIAFPDRSGLLQVGVSIERVSRAFDGTPTEDYLGMRFGLYGHFEGVDLDRDGFVDQVEDAVASGRVTEGFSESVNDDGERIYIYTFSCLGRVFRAVLPEREFYEQRKLMLTIGGVALALIVVLLTTFLVKLSLSSFRLEAMHRAAEERTIADMALARVIQLSALLRAELFRIPHLEAGFDAVTYPAREVGGDFYSMFELSDGRVAFLVADVSGKGVPAAMFMHVANNVIKTGFHVEGSASIAVSKVNDYLCEHNEAEMFVTAWIGVLDPKTGEVEYVNAGHNRPYLLRRDGRLERIDGRSGLFLGSYPGRTYRSHRLKLHPGDRLFLYTDGVTEAMDRHRCTYGAERLEKLLKEGPADICTAVKDDVSSFVRGAEPSDDLTMLVLSWHGEVPAVEREFAMDASSSGRAMEFLRSEIRLTNAAQISRLLNAMDELVANVIGYSGGHRFWLSVRNVPGRCQVTIVDDGTEYSPLSHLDPDTHQPLQDRPVGGLGILMAKKLVSSMTYCRENGQNRLAVVQSDVNGKYRQIV